MNFTAPGDEDLHLILWHDLLKDGVTGSIIWNYSYQRSFGEAYWSLIVVVLIIILIVLTFVFQKQVIPPIAWTLTKAKYYIFTVPWKYTKKGFGWLGSKINGLWKRLRGIELDEEELSEGEEGKKLEEEVEKES